MMEPPVTPMMRQYQRIKTEHDDCILFFRLGDFYEMFYDDAITASEVLEITLTGKDCGTDERAPMCGVPYHSAQNYIAKLVENGYKVAICEQVEDPKTTKGLVKRDVVRIITPGTANIDSILAEGENTYLAAVYFDGTAFGVAFADVSTGDLFATQGENGAAENELANTLACFKPTEVLINDGAARYAALFADMKSRFDFYESFLPQGEFAFDAACARIKEKGLDLGGLSFAHHEAATRALGAALAYLEQTQKVDLKHISAVNFYLKNEFMEIDLSSRRNLELTATMRDKSKRGSLLGVLDKTKTAMGARLMRKWLEQPLIDVEKINRRLDAVAELVDGYDLREQLTGRLKSIADMERLLSKTVYGTCNARDLLALGQSLSQLPGIHSLLEPCQSVQLHAISQELDLAEDIKNLILTAFVDEPPLTVREGGMIRAGFDSELDRIRESMDMGTGVIARIEAQEREATGIKQLKVGYNKVFGYYIEVSKSNLARVPEHYIRKQTLANCERFITQELKDAENAVLGAKDKVEAIEYEDFCYVRTQVSEALGRLQKSAKLVAETDVLTAFASVAAANGYVRPVVDNGDAIDICEGRHPTVELSLRDSFFVPNDTHLNNTTEKFALITGPNMAGKSTYMRQTALIVLMAQAGSFVPAASAHIGAADRIFTRVGASDDLAAGQSTFMVEMSEVANILKNATAKSLVILDEIGRGTSTFDGLSIAWAVTEHLANHVGAKTLFATHYHELTALEGQIAGLKNYSVAVRKRGDEVIFLRKIVAGGTDDSFGIEVAMLAGVPGDVTARAKEVLSSIEQKEAVHAADGAAPATASAPDKDYSAVADKLLKLNVNTITPLEAMTELLELQRLAKEVD